MKEKIQTSTDDLEESSTHPSHEHTANAHTQYGVPRPDCFDIAPIEQGMMTRQIYTPAGTYLIGREGDCFSLIQTNQRAGAD